MVNKEGFDNKKRWGNSAQKGHGVNSPAMMDSRKKSMAGKMVSKTYTSTRCGHCGKFGHSHEEHKFRMIKNEPTFKQFQDKMDKVPFYKSHHEDVRLQEKMNKYGINTDH